MTDLNFSDEQLDTQQDFDNWEPTPEFAPPPPAATYRFFLSKLHTEGNNAPSEKDTKVGKRLFLVVDTQIVGGEYDGRKVNFQRLNNVEFTDRQGKRRSFMLDMIKSAGVSQAPRSNKEFYLAVQGLADRGPGASFGGELNWTGTCTACRDKKLMELTHTTNAAAAKEAATKEQFDEVREFALKFKNYRAFPIRQNGTKDDMPLCPTCGEQIRAQAEIRRFLP